MELVYGHDVFVFRNLVVGAPVLLPVAVGCASWGFVGDRARRSVSFAVDFERVHGHEEQGHRVGCRGGHVRHTSRSFTLNTRRQS